MKSETIAGTRLRRIHRRGDHSCNDTVPKTKPYKYVRRGGAERSDQDKPWPHTSHTGLAAVAVTMGAETNGDIKGHRGMLSDDFRTHMPHL